MINGYLNKVCDYDKWLLLRLFFKSPRGVEFTIKTSFIKTTR